jgi:DNA-binding NtrC family response regulator
MENDQKTVLLVDAVRSIHKLFDEENPFGDKINTIHFYSAKEALNYLRSNNVHLVISCISFVAFGKGNIYGLHLLRECKELNPKLPFIIHSAMDYRDDFYLSPWDAYIVKSPDLTELFKAVERLLGFSPSIF